MRSRLPALSRLAVLSLLAFASSAAAQSGENVLLVVNETSQASVRVGEHYARWRGVPQGNVLRVAAAVNDEISRSDYERQIQGPISAWLGRNAAQDRILYIVLAKGVPLRVAGTRGRNGTVASVDSELAVLYRRMVGLPAPPAGPLRNPYFLGDRPVAQARVFTHREQDIFLVTRLDGFTAEDVIGLIDRGAVPSREGRFLLDGKAAWDDRGNQWLENAARWLTAHGSADRVVVDMTSRVLTDERNVLGYYSWGSNDPAIRIRRFSLGFVPGAVGAMFVSSDGRTFTEPPADWTIGTWEKRESYYAGSPQSLAGDLIREGITGVAGHVAEPYLDATVRPDILFPAYVSGLNLAESFYLAVPYLSWQTVIVGDPLCAPFPRQALAPGDIDKGLDPATEMPAFFSDRRLLAVAVTGRSPEALKLVLKAEARTAREDRAGARRALEHATLKDERLAAAQLSLASVYEQDGEHDKAIDRYRRVLAIDPDNPTALNNLAWDLAAHKNQPADALPLAERAYTLSKNNLALAGAASDTLGWVYHLLGRNGEASKLMAEAVKLMPASAEVRLHAAIVYVEIGQLEGSLSELSHAVELDPTLEKRDDVKKLRARLHGTVKR